MKEKTINKKAILLLIICMLLTIALIVGCVFFPEEIFGLIQQNI